MRLARLPYFATLLLLTAVLFVGRTEGGAGRWLGVGSFSVQPAEFAKISLILVLAAVLDDRRGSEALAGRHAGFAVYGAAGGLGAAAA